MSLFVRCLLSFFLLSLPLTARPTLKEHMLRDLEHIREVFAVKYAPIHWKEAYKGWNLDEEINLAKSKVEALPRPTIKEFQKILTAFFQSTADYHVSVKYYATAASVLDFNIKGVDGKYYIIDIDRNYLPLSTFPFNIGDELVQFNDRPIALVMEEFKERHFPGGNTPETDQGLAEACFTKRSASKGFEVPTGSVKLGIRKKNGSIYTHTMRWDHSSEKIGDPSKYRMASDFGSFAFQEEQQQDNFLTRVMCTPYWNREVRSLPASQASHQLGARTSFLPKLGNKIWSTPSSNSFDSYIFKSPKGQSVGYIRIPHYMCDEEEAEEFQVIIKKLQNATQALVIDQLNNPGGSVFYLYALASMLTDKPLVTPKHHIALTQEDVYTAIHILSSLENVNTTQEAQEVLGETFGGYPVTLKFVATLKGFCTQLITEWESGNTFTEPTYLFGVDDIYPYPKSRYTKPILILTNALDFSGGDFFPAILQDNKRALVVGTRTAGAGGYVMHNTFHNLSSIQSFNLTGSLAIRDQGEPLENLGVKPDIHLDLTANDLQNDYIDYKTKLLTIIDKMLEKKD